MANSDQKNSQEKGASNNFKLLLFVALTVALVSIGVVMHEEDKKQKPLAEDFFKARKQVFSDPDVVPVEEMTNKQKAERNIFLQD